MTPSQIAPQDHEPLEPVGPRPRFSDAKRSRIFLREFGVCYLCKVKIAAGEPWDLEHANQRALSGDDSDRNLFPVHKACHKPKTADDAADRAKVKRLQIKHGPPENRPKAQPIRSRGFPRRYDV